MVLSPCEQQTSSHKAIRSKCNMHVDHVSSATVHMQAHVCSFIVHWRDQRVQLLAHTGSWGLSAAPYLAAANQAFAAPAPTLVG